MNRIKTDCEAVLTIKRSIFTATAHPLMDETLIQPYLESLKTRFPKSHHIVYAYHLNEGLIQRDSDDGEPKGTAGAPVLKAIQHYDVTDLIVTVRRDFGGILLGAGGLIRAYSKAAHSALEKAEILIPTNVYEINFTLSYKAFDQADSLISQYLSDITRDFGIGVNVNGFIKIDDFEHFKTLLQDILGESPSIEIEQEKTTYQPRS